MPRAERALRTLVVSDLHLGARTPVDLLREEGALRAPLLERVAQADRVVLLGDLLELRQLPLHRALELAEPFLRALAGALPRRAAVVVVPGNHDHALAEPAIERRRASGAAIDIDGELELAASDPLAPFARLLGRRRLRLHYPGIWLRADVFATHGQYLDCHLTVPTLERLAIGVMLRIAGAIPPRASVGDYESVVAPLYAFAQALAANSAGRAGAVAHGASARIWSSLAGPGAHSRVRRRALMAGFPLAVLALNRAGIGGLRADISGGELRDAGLRAIADVAERLRIDARYVVFGHTHRAGPLPGDAAAGWRSAAGAELFNTGSWVYEPNLATARSGGGPYWPGTAIELEDEGPPRLIELLGGLSRESFAAIRR